MKWKTCHIAGFKNLTYRFFESACTSNLLKLLHVLRKLSTWRWGMGVKGVPHLPKTCSFPPPGKIHLIRFLPPDKITISNSSHCSCTIFVLISYSLDTQVMLILVLIDVQYSQKATFSLFLFLVFFFMIGENHSSGSHLPVKKSPPPSPHSPQQNFQFPSLPAAIWKENPVRY